MRPKIPAILSAMPFILLCYLLGLLTARLALAAPLPQVQIAANCPAPNYCSSFPCQCGFTGLFCAGSIYLL